MKLFIGLAIALMMTQVVHAEAGKYKYVDWKVITAQSRQFAHDYYPQLSQIAWTQIKNMMPACAYLNGNLERNKQLESMQLSDLKFLGTQTLVRDIHNDPTVEAPNFVYIAMIYEIPGGNGAKPVIVSGAARTADLESVNSLISAPGDLVEAIRLYKVEVKGHDRIQLGQLSPITPLNDCMFRGVDLNRYLDQ